MRPRLHVVPGGRPHPLSLIRESEWRDPEAAPRPSPPKRRPRLPWWFLVILPWLLILAVGLLLRAMYPPLPLPW